MRLSLRVAGKTFLFNFQVLFEPGARGRGGAEVLQAAGDHTLEERRTSAKATFGQQVEQLLLSFVEKSYLAASTNSSMPWQDTKQGTSLPRGWEILN